MITTGFLPTSQTDMTARGWEGYDFLLITGDAYVDHPSFGAAVIGRVLEAEGHRVAILPQPPWRDTEIFLAMGRPRYGVFVTGGNLDSMVAHYTAAKKPRREDFYSPGGMAGLRPDRAAIVYANRAYETIIGYEQNELEGQPSTSVYYDPADRSWLAECATRGGSPAMRSASSVRTAAPCGCPSTSRRSTSAAAPPSSASCRTSAPDATR